MALSFLSKVLPPAWQPFAKFLRQPGRFYLLEKRRYPYATDGLFTQMSTDFMQEPRFAAAYRWAEQLGRPLMPAGGMQWRIYVLCWAAEQARHLPGDFVACGVYSGFCDRAIMEYIDFQQTGKKYVLMDTFQGLDPRYSSPGEIEKQKRYDHDMYGQVLQTFQGFNVQVVKGPIPDTLPQADVQQVCFLSIDMNAVQPEVAALEFFWPRLVRGGVVVLDDYAFPGNEAQKRGHDAFAAGVGHHIFTLPTGQGLLIKTH